MPSFRVFFKKFQLFMLVISLNLYQTWFFFIYHHKFGNKLKIKYNFYNNPCSLLPFILQEELLIQHFLNRFIAAIYN